MRQSKAEKKYGVTGRSNFLDDKLPLSFLQTLIWNCQQSRTDTKRSHLVKGPQAKVTLPAWVGLDFVPCSTLNSF